MDPINVQPAIIGKKWYQSKTLWINILIAIGGALTSLETTNKAGWIVSAASVVNIILRLVTSQPIQ